MKEKKKKIVKEFVPNCVCHLSSINFIIGNLLDDDFIGSSGQIRFALWREMDKGCSCNK